MTAVHGSCGAGTTLRHAELPDWQEPCTADGVAVVVVAGGDDGSWTLELCAQHLAQLDSLGVLVWGFEATN